jgi:hypothetical protein
MPVIGGFAKPRALNLHNMRAHTHIHTRVKNTHFEIGGCDGLAGGGGRAAAVGAPINGHWQLIVTPTINCHLTLT